MAADPRPARSVVSSDQHLEETRVEGARVFDGALLDVRRDVVRLPDGATTIREYIVHPGAVLIIPVLADGRFVVERQFRYPLHRVFLEFPAGKLDAGESALGTAQRELTEETGYIAARWTRLGLIHPTVSYSTEAIEIFVAGDLSHVGRKLDDGEFLDIAEMTSDALLAALDDGELTDAKTVAALLMYLRKHQNRSAPPLGAEGRA